jgi:signal transduction histidine kinase
MSLKKRLLIYFMVIFLLIMLITISIIFNRQRSLIENEMSERVRILSDTLSQISLEPLLVYEISSLEQNLESIEDESYVEYARIVTKDNLILASTEINREGELMEADLNEGIYREKELLIGVSRIEILGNIIGYSEVAVSLVPMHKKINTTMRMIILVFGLSFLTTLILANLMINHLLKPINSLTDAVRKIPENKFDISNIDNKKLYGEVEELYDSIAWMYEELRKIRSQLIEETKLATIGKMSSYIAHEIRNPLEAMSGAVEVVSMDEDNRKNEFMEIIKEEIESLNNFLNNFMSFASQESFDRDAVKIDKIIRRILYLFDNLFSSSQIDLTVNYQDLPPVEVDEKRIECVFTNIILNAAEAVERKGKIIIDMYQKADWIIVSVADSGPGIKTKEPEQIFEPFFSTKKHGTGIGLSISREIIELHNGSITFVNTEDGAKFIIKIPLWEAGLNEEDFGG